MSWAEVRDPRVCRPILIALLMRFLQQLTGITPILVYLQSIFSSTAVLLVRDPLREHPLPAVLGCQRAPGAQHGTAVSSGVGQCVGMAPGSLEPQGPPGGQHFPSHPSFLLCGRQIAAPASCPCSASCGPRWKISTERAWARESWSSRLGWEAFQPSCLPTAP